MDLTILEDLGLSAAEAKTYVALLEKGESKTGTLIDATGLQSSTVYHVLGSLIEKGLVSFILKGKIKHYQAERPESFFVFLEEKKRKLNEILPKLKEKEQLGKIKQTARIYQGFNGLKTAFNEILTTLKKGEEYYFFQISKKDLLKEDISLFFRNYHLKRAEKGIKVKGLAIKTIKKQVEHIFKDLRHTQIRYVDEFMPRGLIIYGDKLITLDWGQAPTVFVIQSKAVADSYKEFFEQKWNKSKQ